MHIFVHIDLILPCVNQVLERVVLTGCLQFSWYMASVLRQVSDSLLLNVTTLMLLTLSVDFIN